VDAPLSLGITLQRVMAGSHLSTKGSAEFVRDYYDCEESARRYANDQDKCNNPCLFAREHTRCMKEKHGWKIDRDAEQ